MRRLLAGLAVTAVVLTPTAATAEPFAASQACYADYDANWCDRHAAQLAAAKPVFADLAVEEVGGYRPGDTVPIQGQQPATIGPEDTPMLQALERHVPSPMHAWAVLTIAGESRWNQHAANPTSTARGYAQFLALWWRDRLPGDWTDPDWQARAMAHLLAHGGTSHWAYRADLP